MDQQDQNILMFAASGLRDKLKHYPDSEICALHGRMGLDVLVRDVVRHLRERGVDDEGAWECDATKDIPVSPAGSAGQDLSVLSERVWRSMDLAVHALTDASSALERAGDERTRGFVRSALIELNGALIDLTGALDLFARAPRDAGDNREEDPAPRSGG